MKQDQKIFLLQLAQNTLYQKVLQNTYPEINVLELSPELTKERGVHITLRKNGKIRAAKGHIIPVYPLYRGIMENIKTAALDDPEFPPITPEELPEIEIEISVLTFPQKLIYESKEDLLQKLEEKKYGVILEKDYHSGTFLPQMWEIFPEKEQFLSELCKKAALPEEEWKKGDIKIKIYEVEKLEEE